MINGKVFFSENWRHSTNRHIHIDACGSKYIVNATVLFIKHDAVIVRVSGILKLLVAHAQYTELTELKTVDIVTIGSIHNFLKVKPTKRTTKQ